MVIEADCLSRLGLRSGEKLQLPPKVSAAKRSKMSAAKGSKEPPLQEPTNASIRPLGEAVLHLIHAAVANRIRFRALLDTLENTRPFKFADYVARYRTLCERDGAALVSQIMLTDEEFKRLFGEWKSGDDDRYGHNEPTRRLRSKKTTAQSNRAKAALTPGVRRNKKSR
jgi:hypothetical protein